MNPPDSLPVREGVRATGVVRSAVISMPGALGLIAVLASPVGSLAENAAAPNRPAIEGDLGFTVSYFKGFIESCTKEVHGDPDIGKLACSCAATVVADRFTAEELTRLGDGGLDAYDKIHPGTSKLIGICGEAAKATVKK